MRTSPTVYRAVVVSPHLDDAVFSCGGLIPRWRQEGPVLVVNVFTDFSNPPPRSHVALGEVRQREESAAAQLLGFESVSLNEPEGTCRHRAYLSPGLLFGGVPLPEDENWLPDLQKKLETVLAGLSYDSLYLPLGVGWHVDHLLCHRATHSFHADSRTHFYEDRPYADIPHAVDFRLGQPGDWFRAGRAAARVACGWTPIRGLPWGPVRWLGEMATHIFFWRLYRRHRRSHAEPIALRSQTHDVSATRDLWLKGILAYGTQVSAFFPNRAALENILPAHVRTWQK